MSVLSATVVAFACVGAVDPNEPGRYPPCPVAAFAGLSCPGCGGLRSAYAVADGDLAAAVGANALAVVGFAAWGAWLLGWLLRSARGQAAGARAPAPWRTGRRRGVTGVLPAFVLTLAAVFTLARNLPVGAVLAP